MLHHLSRPLYLAFALGLMFCLPANATTMVRRSLDALAADDAVVVTGQVRETRSYWNADHTFILTDVQFTIEEIVAGQLGERQVTITTLGGTVGDTSTIVIGSPELSPGFSYLLFLRQAIMLDHVRRLTVPELVQGTFDLIDGWAFSQAANVPLAPDPSGLTEPPGGRDGLPIHDLIQVIRRTTDQR